MKSNHHHHSHSHKQQQKKAQEQGDDTKERLKEKTLHAHNKAMPHGEGTSSPHEQHVGHAKYDDHGGHHDYHRMMIEDIKRRF